MDVSLIVSLLGCCGIALNLVLGPLILMVARRMNLTVTRTPGRAATSASVIVPLFNEEENVLRKLDNLRTALGAVKGISVEVILGSDGSTDRTVALAEQWIESNGPGNWTIMHYDNEGKCQTINKMVRATSGQVIISTDADVMIPENSVRSILEAFRSLERVGCVSCVPLLAGRKMGSQDHYWDIEGRIRKAESSVGHLIVTTGWLYAYRREAFEEIPRGVMADDLWVPLVALLKGYRSIQLEELLVLSEKTDEVTEVKRRRRVIAGGMDVVRRLWPRLMRKPAVLSLVLAHKINRWALPIWIALVLIGTVTYKPVLAVVYGALAMSIWFALGTRRLRMIVDTVTTPVSALMEVALTTDLSKWQHTRMK